MRRRLLLAATLVAVGSCSPTGNDGTGPSAAVATVTVAPALDTVYIGAVSQLTATLKDADGNTLTGKTITWSKTGTGANVSTGGLVSGISSGDLTVTATSEGVAGNSSILVRPVPVVSVVVTPPTDTIYLGAVATFAATPKDSVGGTLAGRTVIWSSLDAAASVNNIGVVTSLSLGTARIVGNVEGKADTTIVTVLPVPVASVVVTPSADTLYPTNTSQLTAVTRDSAAGLLTGRTVTWSSLNAAATVSISGLVTAVSVGSARIVATSEGKADTTLITVLKVPVASIVVTPATDTLYPTNTSQLSAVTRDSAAGVLVGRVVTWASLDATASVSGTGLVTAVSVGSARIVGTSEGKADTTLITVLAVPVASVLITPGAPTLHTRETRQLTATPRDSAANPLAGRVVTWLSFDTTLVTVSGTGLITPHDTGDVQISATSEGKADTVLVHVTLPPVGGVVITPAVDTVVVGDSIQLTAAVLDTAGVPLTGRPVSWSSLDTTAFVPSSNFVVGSYLGIARIVATREGHADTATVLVVAVAPVLPPLTGTWIGHGIASAHGPFDIVILFTQTDSTLAGSWEGGQTDFGAITGEVHGTATLIHADGANEGTCISNWTATRIGADSLDGTFQFSGGVCPFPNNNGPLSAHRAPATASVVITASTGALVIGDSAQFAAEARDSGGTPLSDRGVRWSSTDTTVATVTKNGLVQALSIGSAGIIAAGQGKADTATVIVSSGGGGSSLGGTWIGIVNDTSGALAFTFVQVGSALTGGHIDLQNVNPGSIDGVVDGDSVTILIHHIRIGGGYCEGTWNTVRSGPDSLVGDVDFSGAGGCTGSANIVAARKTSGTGKVGPFDVSVTADEEEVSGVASDGVNALVVFQRGVTDTLQPSLLFARLVDSTGSTIGGEVALGSSGDPPTVAYGDSTYLAAWWLPYDQVVAQRFNLSGAPIGGIFTLASTSGIAKVESTCGVAFSNHTFLVTYQRATGDTTTGGDLLYQIVGRTVSTGGAIGSEFQVSDGFGECTSVSGQLAGSAEGFFVLWRETDSVAVSGSTLKGRMIAANGTLGALQLLGNTSGQVLLQSVVSRANGGWVTAWNEIIDTLANTASSARMLDAQGAPTGGVISIGGGGAPTLGVVGSWAGGWSVIWLERPASAAASTVSLQYYAHDGTPVGAARILANVDGGGKVPYPLANTEGIGRNFVALQFMSPGSGILGFDSNSGDFRGVWVRP